MSLFSPSLKLAFAIKCSLHFSFYVTLVTVGFNKCHYSASLWPSIKNVSSFI